MNIPDKNFEKLIREIIQKPEGEISEEDCLSITQLDFRDLNVQDLTGLEHFNNVTSVNLAFCYPKDLNPLAGLVNLEYLNLYNLLIDISPLQNLVNLKYLDLSFNMRYVKPEILRNFTKLNTLILWDTNLKDLYFLENINLLTHLNIGRNASLNDLSILEKYKNLQTLNLSQISTHQQGFEVLRKLSNLEDIDLNFCKFHNICFLENLIYLKDLAIGWNENLHDLSPLKNLLNLNRLSVTSCKVSDISGLRKLNNLSSLKLGEFNQISDIEPLKDLFNLRELNLNKNKINDISPLRNLVNISDLNISLNLNISDLEPLINYKNLQYLDISGNNIKDISVLQTLLEKGTFKKGSKIDMRKNMMDLREGTKNREIVNNFLASGVEVEWK